MSPETDATHFRAERFFANVVFAGGEELAWTGNFRDAARIAPSPRYSLAQHVSARVERRTSPVGAAQGFLVTPTAQLTSPTNKNPRDVNRRDFAKHTFQKSAATGNYFFLFNSSRTIASTTGFSNSRVTACITSGLRLASTRATTSALLALSSAATAS